MTDSGHTGIRNMRTGAKVQTFWRRLPLVQMNYTAMSKQQPARPRSNAGSVSFFAWNNVLRPPGASIRYG